MLIDHTKAIGFFIGLTEGGLNFDAELTLTYNSDFQNRPMIGQFVLIALERDDQAVLGRITAVASHGKLASVAGEDLGARTVQENRGIPEDLKKQFLRYRCAVRLMGVLKESGDRIVFTPSHRRLPHMGAKVVFPDDRVLRYVAGAERAGAKIGFYALGEFVFAYGHKDAKGFDDRFSIEEPCIEPRFDASAMVARRTAVLAKSGYGKSNLLKLLFARLYEKEGAPVVDRQGVKVPVGTLVFDPDGDYFWPGSGTNSPPGLCDIQPLRDRIVLVTDRVGPHPFYNAFKVASPRLDLREMSPGLVLPLVLTDERMSQRGTEALLRMGAENWRTLLDAASLERATGKDHLTEEVVSKLCRLTGNGKDIIANGVRSTVRALVARHHDPQSNLLSVVTEALRAGKLVIVDLSLMRGEPATELAALLLRYLFQQNVEEYTNANSGAIPIIALVEEAQKVLEGKSAKHGPFVEWVKEGRKYDLGAVLVTQQPGAIDNEILSQTDNFFAFHLISAGDLRALKDSNGHFSDDVLAALLNEPIEGQGYMWSSAGSEKSTYPVPFRAYNLASLFQRTESAVLDSIKLDFYAVSLRGRCPAKPAVSEESLKAALQALGGDRRSFPNAEGVQDKHQKWADQAQKDSELAAKFSQGRIPRFVLESFLKNTANRGPKRNLTQEAYAVITAIWGLHGYGWRLETKTSGKNNAVEWIISVNPADGLQRLKRGESPLGESTHQVPANPLLDDFEAVFGGEEPDFAAPGDIEELTADDEEPLPF